MNNFGKMFLASLLAFILGTIILSCLSFIMMMGVLVATVSTVEHGKASIEESSILKVDCSLLQEKVEFSPFDGLFKSDYTQPLSLSQLIATIREAKDNPNISGIYLTATHPGGGMASVDELRRALLEFKKSGKFIIAYGDSYSQKGYYLASVADEIYLNPQGMLELNGIYVSNVFYKKALENFGVKMQVFKVGTYKGAVEPFLLDKLSEPNREQISSFSNALWQYMLKEIGKSRGLGVAELQTLADSCPMFLSPEELVEKKIISKALFENDVEQILREKTGVSTPRYVSLAKLNDTRKEEEQGVGKVGVVFAEGAIKNGEEQGTITEQLADRLYKIADNPNIESVVLRVNSPGGSSFVSEIIWNAVCYVKSKKPIVVSMGDYAASGGYYISCASSYIFAEPTTITGSIGIYGLFPNFAGTAKKLSVTEDGVKTAEFADFGNMYRPMTDKEKSIMQAYIERGYDTFLTRVAKGRNMTKEDVNIVAQGRVWTGSQALSHKLVDELGGLDEAIKKAASLASLEDYSVEYEDTQRDQLDFILSKLMKQASVSIISMFLTQDELKALQESRMLRDNKGVQARLVYSVEL